MVVMELCAFWLCESYVVFVGLLAWPVWAWHFLYAHVAHIH